MIVFCEECGEMFIIEQEIDPLEILVFQCRNCDETVRVVPPGAKSSERVEK